MNPTRAVPPFPPRLAMIAASIALLAGPGSAGAEPAAPASAGEITAVLNRVRDYLEVATPAKLVDRRSGREIADFSAPNPDAILARSDFQLTSYEWGVTYAGMLLAGEATGDARFTAYAARRLEFISKAVPIFREQIRALPPPPDGRPGPGADREPGPWRAILAVPLRPVVLPRSLDDSGSMCAAMIKADRAGVGGDLRPLIGNYMAWIREGQFRLADGTLARNRPLPDTLWLDDLYMSVPALAQMGRLTGEGRYYDDAVRQILQFSERMFLKEKGLYMHSWVSGMEVHPAFLWGRANGWALMAMTELLDVLPAGHPGRPAVLEQFRAHVRGLAACQGGDGLWHQLLDRSDSYPETSASAIFVYCLARGINRGWIDPLAHAPMTSLGWNAVARKVNDKGQVEGVCVGTGTGFEPAFYYARPTSVLAAHGYGPVLLAGAEMIAFRKGKGGQAVNSDGGVRPVRPPRGSDAPTEGSGR